MSIDANEPSTNPARIILHVDMDSFYASCELKTRPELKTKPFIVGADPKNGKGRGVVISCNYEARKFKVRSGMPISLAWNLCPDAFYLRPNFALYSEVSSRVMKVMKPFAEKMERVSIDEAFLDVSGRIGKWDLKAVSDYALELKNAVLKAEQITCTVGASNSKIVAKIATDMRKPDGLTIVEPGKVKEFLFPLPVEKIPGVGKVTQKTLNEKLGIKTIGELARTDIQALEERFGRSALWLKNVAQGIDPSSVHEISDYRSISSETTFDEDEGDYSLVSKTMREVALDVFQRTRDAGYLFSNVAIKVRFTGFETHTKQRTLPGPTNSLETLISECEKLLADFSLSGKKVRLIGIRVSGLQKKSMEAEEQSTLLDWNASDDGFRSS